MPSAVQVDVSEIVRAFEELTGRAANISPVMGQVAEYLKLLVQERISDANSWAAPLEDPNREIRARFEGRPPKGPGNILQDSGIMAGGMLLDSGPEHAEVSASHVLYSKFHVSREHGGTGGTRKMAERDFLAIDMDAALEKIADMIVREIAR